jgi:hypothetical protein
VRRQREEGGVGGRVRRQCEEGGVDGSARRQREEAAKRSGMCEMITACPSLPHPTPHTPPRSPHVMHLAPAPPKCPARAAGLLVLNGGHHALGAPVNGGGGGDVGVGEGTGGGDLVAAAVGPAWGVGWGRKGGGGAHASVHGRLRMCVCVQRRRGNLTRPQGTYSPILRECGLQSEACGFELLVCEISKLVDRHLKGAVLVGIMGGDHSGVVPKDCQTLFDLGSIVQVLLAKGLGPRLEG